MKLYNSLIFLLFCILLCGCSSENTPIAEVFLGNRTIYEKYENNTKDTNITGEMNISFGTDIINFTLTTNEDLPVSLTGNVYDANLYEDYDRKIHLGSLELDDDILRITLENGITYYAR